MSGPGLDGYVREGIDVRVNEDLCASLIQLQRLVREQHWRSQPCDISPHPVLVQMVSAGPTSTLELPAHEGHHPPSVLQTEHDPTPHPSQKPIWPQTGHFVCRVFERVDRIVRACPVGDVGREEDVFWGQQRCGTTGTSRTTETTGSAGRDSRAGSGRG
jgi:hypothetical protein